MMKRASSLKARLDGLYEKYNRREFVHPDPLEFLYRYDDPADREIVGLVASSLAYGRVEQILKSVSNALERMGPGSPGDFLADSSRHSLASAFSGFKHRFTTGEDLAALLFGVKRIIERNGSLGACFTAHCRSAGDETVIPALSAFVAELRDVAGAELSMLLPSPEGGSACKRLNLYLRWMVRQDGVDPGGWEGVPPSKLLVPLDVHMTRICKALGFTSRKPADLRTALEVTRAFAGMIPEDPVRYDFALSRLGIRRDVDLTEALAALTAGIRP